MNNLHVPFLSLCLSPPLHFNTTYFFHLLCFSADLISSDTPRRKVTPFKMKNFIAMKTGPQQDDAIQLINSDFQDLSRAATNLARHAVKLGSLGFGTSFLQWVASVSAMYDLSLSFSSFCIVLVISSDLYFLCFSQSLLFNHEIMPLCFW